MGTELGLAGLWVLLGIMVVGFGWLAQATEDNWRRSAKREAERLERLRRLVGTDKID